MSYITAIGTANPSNQFDQATICAFMEKAMCLDARDSRKLRTIFKSSGINYRHSVLADYGREENFSFYPNKPGVEAFPSTAARLALFRENALPLSLAAVRNLLGSLPSFDVKSITHLVVVCCTGMYAPGLDIDLVKALTLPFTVARTSITFMGCYAAFNALKAADAFCTASADAKVLIVCTELCSLHFQPTSTDDNLLANALFADGSAALLVEGKTNQRKRLAIEHFHNDLAPEGAQDMAWSIGDLGFEMKLSAYVPDILKGGIKNLTTSLLAKASRQMEDIRYFAFHPGGKRILEAIEEQLGLTREHNAPAYRVLQRYGNMSSPTVVFVLHELFKTLGDRDHNAYVLSAAFGPGLTLESMILKIEVV